MRLRHASIQVAAVTAALLTVSACGGPVLAEQDSAAPANILAAAGSITVAGCTPQNPLIPTDTTETCGGMILDAVTRKLVRYDGAGTAVNDLAASITTSDAKKYTVKLKPGVKFSDGTVVKASNFVGAWNFGAYGRNAQLNSYYFEDIKGYRAVASSSAKKMTGLKVVNDTTFTVELAAKNSAFRQRLGYLAFAPVPTSFFADRGEAFGRKPVGAGPYKVVSASPASKFVLQADPGYQGATVPTVKTVTVKVYPFVGAADAAYDDLVAGKIDALDHLPASVLVGGLYKADLPGRTMQRTLAVLQLINFPSPKADTSYRSAKLRKAISMAIDRKKIVGNVFSGTRQAATGWVAPGVSGYAAGGCGTFCTFRPAQARRLYKQAGGHSGPITIAYNADSSHREWVDAVCRSIRATLAVTCKGTVVPTFAGFRQRIVERKLTGLFRTGWQLDYPSIENFLAPLYLTGAASNDGDYSNKAFDAKIRAALAKVDPAAANKLFREAERLLRANMPAMPLWYGKAIGGYSAKVETAGFTVFGTYDFAALRLK